MSILTANQTPQLYPLIIRCLCLCVSVCFSVYIYIYAKSPSYDLINLGGMNSFN
jgi:hypothetical protein